jgi:hypothetical protein
LKDLATKFPETFDPGTPADLVYSGQARLTDPLEGTPLDFGKGSALAHADLCPCGRPSARCHAADIHGMVHCSGGAQTKVLHFVEGLRIIKDDPLPIPPLFNAIQRMSGTDWMEMYKVFNMGHRLEFYVPAERAQEIIAISTSFGIEAKVIGRVEAAPERGRSHQPPRHFYLPLSLGHTGIHLRYLRHLRPHSHERPPFQTIRPARPSRGDRQATGDPSVIADQKRFVELNRELPRPRSPSQAFFRFRQRTCTTTWPGRRRCLRTEKDPEMLEMARTSAIPCVPPSMPWTRRSA